MHEIKVFNLHEGERQEWVGRGEYVGRPNALGNPWREGVHGTRAIIIEKFRRWLFDIVTLAQRGRQSEMTDEQRLAYARLLQLFEISQQRTLNLLCYCKPLPCHADVIKSCLEWMNSQGAWKQREAAHG